MAKKNFTRTASIGALHSVKIIFLREFCPHKGLNQPTVQSLGDFKQPLICANFMRASLMLLLNGGVRRMEMMMTLGMESQNHVLQM